MTDVSSNPTPTQLLSSPSHSTEHTRVNNILVGPTQINVKSSLFGAKGDGIADDTAAIQAAINAGPGDIIFPVGIYKTTDVLTVSALGGTRIRGVGRGGATGQGAEIHLTDSSKNMFLLLDGGLAMENLILQHNGNVQVGVGHIVRMGSATVNCSGVQFRDVRFVAAPQDGISIYRAGNTMVSDCDFESMNGACIGARDAAGANRGGKGFTVNGGSMFASPYGIWLQYCDQMAVTGVNFTSMITGGHCIFLDTHVGAGATDPLGAAIVGNTFLSCVPDILNINQPGTQPGHLFVGNSIRGCDDGCLINAGGILAAGNTFTSPTTANTKDAFTVTGTLNTFEANQILGNYRYGYNFQSGDRNSLVGGTIFGIGTDYYTIGAATNTMIKLPDIQGTDMRIVGLPLTIDSLRVTSKTTCSTFATLNAVFPIRDTAGTVIGYAPLYSTFA